MMRLIREERQRRLHDRERTRLSRNAERIKERCATLIGFVREAWRVLQPNTVYVHGWHIDAICQHLEAITDGRINRLLINVPPGTMKSLLVSVFWPAWEWTKKPGISYLTTSYSEGYVKRDSRRMRDLVESEWYQSLWGDTVRLSRKAEISFENTARGAREGKPFASLTGGRGDRVIIDDPHSTETAESPAERENTIRIFRESVPTRLNDPVKSAIVVIMQRLHESDVSGQIIALKLGYEHLMLPMEFEPDRASETTIGFTDPRTYEGELLFPERFPREAVERDKVPMGSYAVAGQFQQRPAPREGRMFKRHWFEGRTVAAAPADTQWVRRWDLAATQSKTAARTAGIKLGRGGDGRFYVGHVIKTQEEGAAIRRLIKSTAETDGRGVEISLPQDPGQAGKVQAQDMIAMLAGYVARAQTETGDKVTRAEPFAAQCEAGNVYLVHGDWNESYLDELCVFPSGTFKDQTDASSGAFAHFVGVNRVFTVAESEIIAEDRELPRHWRRAFSLIVSRDKVSAVWGVHDVSADVIWLYAEYTARRTDFAIHAAALKDRCKTVTETAWVPGVFDPTDGKRSAEEGERIVARLLDFKVDIFTVDGNTEAAVQDMADRLAGKRLRALGSLSEWLAQYRNYRRDKKGDLDDETEDGLMRATAMLCLSGIQIATTDIALEHDAEDEWAEQGRNAVTGY